MRRAAETSRAPVAAKGGRPRRHPFLQNPARGDDTRLTARIHPDARRSTKRTRSVGVCDSEKTRMRAAPIHGREKCAVIATSTRMKDTPFLFRRGRDDEFLVLWPRGDSLFNLHGAFPPLRDRVLKSGQAETGTPLHAEHEANKPRIASDGFCSSPPPPPPWAAQRPSETTSSGTLVSLPRIRRPPPHPTPPPSAAPTARARAVGPQRARH